MRNAIEKGVNKWTGEDGEEQSCGKREKATYGTGKTKMDAADAKRQRGVTNHNDMGS